MPAPFLCASDVRRPPSSYPNVVCPTIVPPVAASYRLASVRSSRALYVSSTRRSSATPVPESDRAVSRPTASYTLATTPFLLSLTPFTWSAASYP